MHGIRETGVCTCGSCSRARTLRVSKPTYYVRIDFIYIAYRGVLENNGDEGRMSQGEREREREIHTSTCLYYYEFRYIILLCNISIYNNIYIIYVSITMHYTHTYTQNKPH